MDNNEIKETLGTSNYLLDEFKEGLLNKMLSSNKPALVPYFFILDILRNIVVHGDSFDFETTLNMIKTLEIRNYNDREKETLNKKCETFYKKITNSEKIDKLLNMMQYINGKLIFELELSPQEEISEEEAAEEKAVKEDEIIDLFKKREEIRERFGNKNEILKSIKNIEEEPTSGTIQEKITELRKSLEILKKIKALAHHKTYNFKKPKRAPSLYDLAIPPGLKGALQELDIKVQEKPTPNQRIRK